MLYEVITAERVTQDSFDFTTSMENNPIYISLGTVFNQSIDFYMLCFEAFENSNHTIIMSIGDRVQIADLGNIPTNFIVVITSYSIHYTKLYEFVYL